MPATNLPEMEKELRFQGIMVEGPNKGEYDDYDKVYPHQRQVASVKTAWKKSTLYRLIYPKTADYNLRSDVKEKYVEDRMRWLEHTGK